MKLLLVNSTFLFVLCCSMFTNSVAWGQNNENYYQMGGLEAIAPQGYKVNSHIADGVVNTSFRREEADMRSMLLVSVTDTKNEISFKDIEADLEGLQQMFQSMGCNVGPFSQCTINNKKAYTASGKTSLMGFPVRIIVKIFFVDRYYVMVIEYYGEDYSDDYTLIEESIRVSTKQSLSGIQSISKGGYRFKYDASSLIAVSSQDTNGTSFTFTYKKAGEEANFMEINFLNTNKVFSEASVEKWFDNVMEILQLSHSYIELKPMEKTTFLGQPGYVRKGYATPLLSDNTVKVSIIVCSYNDKWVWSITEQTLDSFNTTNKLFDYILSSFKYQ